MANVRSMKRIAVLLAVAVLAGCTGSDSGETGAPVVIPAETLPDDVPTTYEEILARAPAFDVLPSPDVAAYREASLSAFLDVCVLNKYGEKADAYVGENRDLLDDLPPFPGAALEEEVSERELDSDLCGHVVAYETRRRYRLPPSAVDSAVLEFYAKSLADWETVPTTDPGHVAFRREDARLLISVHGGLVLEADYAAYAEKREPPRDQLPPRPRTAQWPLSTYDRATDPQPRATKYSVEPGTTCERSFKTGGPSEILPPPPGLSARLTGRFRYLSRSYEQGVEVRWRFGTIFGDCPPTSIRITLRNPRSDTSLSSIPYDVRARAGVVRIPVYEGIGGVMVVTVYATSLDGTQSRPVSVLVRR